MTKSFKRRIDMECIHCKSEMKKAKMFAGTGGTPIIEGETKNILETTERSTVECYVCTQCGYVELKAIDYKKF